jgi:hypothetical protein
VAVATGMFTLGDQIFPNEAGAASASVGQYEQAVGYICNGLNQADAARVANERNLQARLAKAQTTLDERNAVLDSWD